MHYLRLQKLSHVTTREFLDGLDIEDDKPWIALLCRELKE
jgi:hypothetical protein